MSIITFILGLIGGFYAGKYFAGFKITKKEDNKS